jgi:HAE1 family hydrophobic/amphiphilic exporter-1
MQIADFSIRRPVFAVMLIGALVGLGAISVGRLGVDLFPRIEFPYMAVTIVLEGANPETVESEVTDVLEDHLNTISGIKELRSVSSEGLSQVFIQFELSEDADVKAEDVREKVARAVAELPPDAESPVVEKVDPDSAPILSVMVSGDLPIRSLTEFADRVVKERIQRVPGVGSAQLVGGREREIRIWLDADRLRSYGLTAPDVIQAIRAEHADIPGGLLEADEDTSEFSVKTKGEVETAREFADIVVAYREGIPTTVGDVARLEDGSEDERTYAQLDGVRGVSLDIRRQSGRNTVEVARGIKEVVEELRSEAPPGVKLVVARDISRFIEASANDVAKDIVLGGILAVLVTFAFLRSLRSTLIVAVAIPAAIISTFFLFFVMGFTLNMLTLMALSVSIGLLIDDAIVVLESIHRKIEEGLPPMEAASRGTSEVGSAVIAGTASVLAVFLPIAFMQGIIGRFFYEYGLAISFAVAISLLVAVTLTPTFCARVLRKDQGGGVVFQFLENLYARLEAVYGLLLGTALRHRLVVIGLAFVAVYGGIALARGIPLEFSSKADRSEFEGIVELPAGTGIAETKRVARQVAQAVAEVDHVEHAFLTVGAGSQGRVNEMSVYVELSPKQERSTSQLALMDAARVSMRRAAPEAKLVGVNEIAWISGGGFSAYNVEYGVTGPSLDRLEEITNAIVSRMRADPHFVDAKSGFEEGKPELEVLVDRRMAADLGVPIRSLATTVRALIGGIDVASFEEDGRRYDVRVRLERDQRDDLDEVGRIQVRPVSAPPVELAGLATLRVSSGPAQIERENRGRKVSFFANTPEGVALGTAALRLDEIVEEVGLPTGYRGKHAGSAQRMRDSAEAVVFAFVMALAALYMILASQFNSFSQPAVIMLSAPLSFVGAFAALSLSGVALSIWAQIGLVALMGLVMKNGILLVDYANQRRSAGETAREAILSAGPVRLRPVLMTALSTIAGMIPVAIATSDGAEFRRPMGLLVIGGLASSTFLTLIVVPVAYTLVADLGGVPGWAARSAARLMGRTGVATESLVEPSAPEGR